MLRCIRQSDEKEPSILAQDFHLPALEKAVQDAIDQGRVGVPKFLRCMAQASQDDQLSGFLDNLLALGEAWFGSRASQRHRLGEDSGVYLTELVKWADGQGALLTASLTGQDATPFLDFMLIGSRGTLYLEERYPVGVRQGAEQS